MQLITHPRFSPSSPIITVREIQLAAACLGLKAALIESQIRITKLEEDLRAANARAGAVTRALHRQACGSAALDSLVAISAAVVVFLGGPLATGSFLWGALIAGLFVILGIALAFYLAARVGEIMDAGHRVPRAPASHLEEPTVAIDPPFQNPLMESIRREAIRRAANHPAARAARDQFESTARSLNKC